MGQSFLFAPEQDPTFAVDLGSEQPERAAGLEKDVKDWLEKVSTGQRVGVDLSAEEEARLDALGYGGGD